MRQSRPITFMTFNVRAFPVMGRNKVEHDFKKVAGDAHVYFWQEQWEAWYRDLIRAALPRKGWAHHLPSSKSGTGTSWRRPRFRLLWCIDKPLHGAVPGVCSYRRFTGAALEEPDTGEEIIVISTHPTPSAFSNRFKGAKKKQVRAAWEAGMRGQLVPFILHHVRMGRPIVIGMDANAKAREIKRVLKDIPGVKIRSHKIDHLVLIDGARYRWRITKAARTIKGVHSDHRPLTLSARLVRR